MANCCRIYTNLSVEECIKLVGNHPAVVRFGENPIVSVNKSYFKNVPEKCQSMTEINLINSINAVNSALNFKGIYAQDLDGFGNELFMLS